MKKLCILLFLAGSSCVAMAGKLSALFSYCTFDNGSGKPYIETYLNVAGNTVGTFLNPNKKYQSSIQVQVQVLKDNATIYNDRYNLNSPESDDDSVHKDFVDVQRIPVENGTYSIQIKISDNHSKDAPFVHHESIVVNYSKDKISISDIELVESFRKSDQENRFSKSGYEIIPMPTNFFPSEVEVLNFYAEVYQTSAMLGNGSDYIIRYHIEDFESKVPAANLGKIVKSKASDVNVVLGVIPIGNLHSGNYNLVVEALGKDGNVLATKKLFIQRARRIALPVSADNISAIKIEGTFVETITHPDTLKEYIRCLYPIESPREQVSAETQLKLGEVRSMQQYFLYFWASRDNIHPETAWKEYKVMVDEVNSHYKTFNRKGYESDRGRVYLQFGPPNTIAASYNEPHAFPYEVWHYYKINDETDKKFVFLSKNRASNDFVLIHSDAKGEVYEPRWELMLSDNQNDYGMDWSSPSRSDRVSEFGERGHELFKNPK